MRKKIVNARSEAKDDERSKFSKREHLVKAEVFCALPPFTLGKVSCCFGRSLARPFRSPAIKKGDLATKRFSLTVCLARATTLSSLLQFFAVPKET